MTLFYEPITPSRMRDFKKKYDILKQLQENERKMQEDLSSLRAVDYSKEKISQTKRKTASGPEIYTLMLEEYKKQIKYYKYGCFKTESGDTYGLVEENKIISRQLARIDSEKYRTVLIKRYIDGFMFKNIAYYLFYGQPDFKTNFEKYLNTVKEWDRAGLAQLEKISQKPYVPTSEPIQLIMEDLNK